jgi:hypothetical protein
LSPPYTSATFWLSNRAKNENRQNRGFKLAHSNAGSANLVIKMNKIEQVVSDNKHHLLGISEAILKRVHDIDDVQLQEYDFTCYKHQSMVGKFREDLLIEEFSSIWIEIGLPGKRKFLLCQLYREWLSGLSSWTSGNMLWLLARRL